MKINSSYWAVIFWEVFIAVILAAAALLSLRFFSGPEDAWLCQAGRWVRHGNPSAPQPTTVCGGQEQSREIEIFDPRPGQTVKFPFSVTGRALGTWFFEASFPVEVNYRGQVVARGLAQAMSDWMTTEFVPFEAEVDFLDGLDIAGAIQGPATLIFKNDNPSGLPQNEKKFATPIFIDSSEIMIVKAYFSNNNLDQEITCSKAFPVERPVVKTEAIARAALEELLKGPNQRELAEGFYTSVNPNVKIQKLTIDQGTAKVDFNETLGKAVGGSCRVSAIRAQIIETLKQFSTVKNVIISINGRTEDILQP